MTEVGQYVAYTFFKVDPAWRRLPVEERVAGKEAFADVVESWAERFTQLRLYSTVGVRPDCDFFLWKITERYDDLGELGAALNGTELAGWLETPYSYLATTKASQYTSARKPRRIVPKGSPYLVVYPFTKSTDWYLLGKEARQGIMNEHMRVGHEYPEVRQLLANSFGVDDMDFLVAYETDDLPKFGELVRALRGTDSRRSTVRDTPILTAVHRPIKEITAMLGATTDTN